MKKNVLLLFLIVITFNKTYAQLTGPRMAQSTLLNQQNIDLTKVKGSPYENEKFASGKLIDEVTGKTQNCFLRLNVITDELEIKDDLSSSKITSMIKSKGIYAVSQGKEYRLNNFISTEGKSYNRISICLLKSKPYSIYKYIEKEFIAEQKAQTSYQKDKPAELKSTSEYFIEKNGTLIPFKLSRKKLIKALPENQKTLEKYIKKNKLDIKDEADLIKALKYYNSL